ncbi:hypothetical protein, variant 8 [Aphanomyces invadans]|uniref:Nucleotide-diphospho-sugar transferase domain-containing protein n=1 Tax=Aphanomyces invadans TaxID=157072 RepID=A0A024TD73_9STRA|nr:hypothetical protein, variant 7 [Aphanomyces invadans]XP_008879278.1 hypothetical protein, variant 8 [Aphanomyces invadans]ETV92114.1 hypothetical protein, variant 7 [Aphanomyces invadans]ETV92115.1 hypothetical protein, variant 8 [Aphanomyces invadans]|eukprot:XP_008879273.1 hypothetical protein, variant 7 [Aphanomyces invadans]
MSRHGTERSLPRSRAMPLMMMCIVCLFVVYIYVLNSSIAAMKDGSDVYRTISQDQWIYQVERYKDFSSIRRGIIVCVFDAMIPMAASLVLELRALGNTELIQMYHCNGELSAASYRILYMIDAHLEIVDVCKDFVASGRLSTSKVSDFRSFWLKPLALVHTRLVEVILLDADDLLFHDPSQLWQVPGYKKTGTIFFFDREVAKAEYLNSRSIHRFQRMQNLHALIETFDYARFGLVKQPSEYLQSTLAWNGHSAHEQDSSIVVINKAIAPLAIDVLLHLVLVTRYQLEFSYGDKELFWLAFELAHVPYSFSPWANTAAAMPGDMAQHPDTICGGLAQWMPLADAKSVLLHINGGPRRPLDARCRRAYTPTPRRDSVARIAPAQTIQAANDSRRQGQSRRILAPGMPVQTRIGSHATARCSIDPEEGSQCCSHCLVAPARTRSGQKIGHRSTTTTTGQRRQWRSGGCVPAPISARFP